MGSSAFGSDGMLQKSAALRAHSAMRLRERRVPKAMFESFQDSRPTGGWPETTFEDVSPVKSACVNRSHKLLLRG